jgi:hypothetical protein
MVRLLLIQFRAYGNKIPIELSSALAGYLGREKDEKGSDRFYFLRDLLIGEILSTP